MAPAGLSSSTVAYVMLGKALTANSIVRTGVGIDVDYLYSIWELERSSNWFIKHPYVPEWTITMNFLEQNGKHIEAKKPQCQSLQHKVTRTGSPCG